MNVIILAGGRGTRLAGIWGRPKCLVPVGGVPLIVRIIEMAASLVGPMERIVVALGHGARDVLWIWQIPTDVQVHGIIEPEPRSTCGGFRAAYMTLGKGPVLVLNGDTLPGYDLRALVAYAESRPGAWSVAAMVHDSERWRDVYAGAAVLSAEAAASIAAETRTLDFPAQLLGSLPFRVPGFLDVGTPEGFEAAKNWRTT